MGPRFAIVALVLVAAVPARAETVGVVVTGVAQDAPELRARIEKWLKADGRELVQGALSPDAIATLANCFVIEDIRTCAAGVVAARAKADSIVYARLYVDALAVTWLRKGHAPASARRTCAPCSQSDLDAMLDQTSRRAALDTGVLHLHSKPEGLAATLDGEAIGQTPLDYDVPVGAHAIALVVDGNDAVQRQIQVELGQEVELTLAPHLAPAPKARKWPLALLGVGIGAVVAGGVLYATSESPTGAHPTYRNTKPLGVVLVIGGLAAGGGGALGYAEVF